MGMPALFLTRGIHCNNNNSNNNNGNKNRNNNNGYMGDNGKEHGNYRDNRGYIGVILPLGAP